MESRDFILPNIVQVRNIDFRYLPLDKHSAEMYIELSRAVVEQDPSRVLYYSDHRQAWMVIDVLQQKYSLEEKKVQAGILERHGKEVYDHYLRFMRLFYYCSIAAKARLFAKRNPNTKKLVIEETAEGLSIDPIYLHDARCALFLLSNVCRLYAAELWQKLSFQSVSSVVKWYHTELLMDAIEWEKRANKDELFPIREPASSFTIRKHIQTLRESLKEVQNGSIGIR